MITLGIETSCDETSASVVKDGVSVLSNVTISSLKEHAQFGGIIPEIASRRQMESIHAVVSLALSKAGLTFDDINLIAVTRSPGLIGSLLVGLCFARGLARAIGKPLIEVDHIKAHVYANFLRLKDQSYDPYPLLPAVGLVVSGGHTSLYKISSFKKFTVLGQTRDDAAGEAFDKVARILDIGYPGGPAIDRLSKEGVNDTIEFPKARFKEGLDFSFSGVKTSVLYYVQKHANEKTFSKSRIAYAFQKSVVEVLCEQSINACVSAGIKTLLVGGGVAANSALRQLLAEQGKKMGIAVFFPPMSLCLDNAAMIAGLG